MLKQKENRWQSPYCTKKIIFNTGQDTILDCSLVPKHLDHPGSEYVETKILDLKDIYNPKNNSVRNGSVVDVPAGDKLAARINANGIEYEFQPPYVIEEDATCPLTSKKYKYVLKSVGNHRVYGLDKLGAESWIFHVYKPFTSQFEADDAAVKTNDHAPYTPMTKVALSNVLSTMVSGNRWGENLSQKELVVHLRKWLLEHASSMDPRTHAAITKSVFQQNAEYTDHVEYTPKEAMNWVESFTDRNHSGTYDSKRGVYGYVTGEGYEREKCLTFALKKFGETGKPYEFVGHVKSPVLSNKVRSSTALKRKQQKDEFELVYSDLDKLFEFKQKYGVYPFKLVSQIAQDRLNEENMEEEVLV